jgi:cytochrome c oxidase subunit 3
MAWSTLEQERHAEQFGMWIFLATEVMLFGGLFTAYTIYRVVYPAAFAEGSRHLDVVLGGVNTLVLIVSSGTMAIAVERARAGRSATPLLVLTGCLGLAFLAIKAVEYRAHVVEGMVPGMAWRYEGAPEVQLFMVAYFTMTGLHALHLAIAIGVVAWMALRRAVYEVAGLYWHFVDVVWVFLLPLLYLYGLA